MGRGDNNLLFGPLRLTRGRPKVVPGILLPEEGKTIFFDDSKCFVLGAEENIFEVNFLDQSVKSEMTLTHTERASVWPGTLVAFHKNDFSYDQSPHPTLGVYHKGNRWSLGMPFVNKKEGARELLAQALRGEILLYHSETKKVYAYDIPEESEMSYTESLLNPNLWQERSVNVEHFVPGEGGALLFFEGDDNPLYIAADGREYTFPFANIDNLGKPKEKSHFIHTVHGRDGMIYLSDGQKLKIVDFKKGLVSHITDLEEAPKKISGDLGRAVLLFSDKVQIYEGKDLLIEEEIEGISDLYLYGDNLTLLVGDRVVHKNINKMIKEG